MVRITSEGGVKKKFVGNNAQVLLKGSYFYLNASTVEKFCCSNTVLAVPA